VITTGQARTSGAQSTPQSQRLAAGEAEVKRLLLLIDVDKNGRISKAEFMAFMEAEFNRLDQDKSGELDTKELTQFQLRTKPGFLAVGK
jgi:Ca2+-binding EF-hand superfamily protein